MLALPQMPPTEVYVFRDASLARGGEATVSVADRKTVDARLGKSWNERLFGGCAVYSDPNGQDLAGVWGARNASRFRRFLREAGTELAVRHCRPVGLRLRLKLTLADRPRISILPHAPD